MASGAKEGGATKRRATLSDTDNLGVGACAGMLETCIQSELAEPLLFAEQAALCTGKPAAAAAA